MSADNFQNDFLYSPWIPQKCHHITLSALSVQNFSAKCMMMMLGYYPLKRFVKHYYYGITSDQLQYKKENNYT